MRNKRKEGIRRGSEVSKGCHIILKVQKVGEFLFLVCIKNSVRFVIVLLMCDPVSGTVTFYIQSYTNAYS